MPEGDVDDEYGGPILLCDVIGTCTIILLVLFAVVATRMERTGGHEHNYTPRCEECKEATKDG